MENNDPKVTFSRKNVLPAFLGIIIGAGILLAIMMLLQPKLMNNALIFSFADVMAGCAEGSFFYQVMWVLEDLSEGTFMVSIPGTVCLVVFALVAAYLEKKKSAHMGSGVDGNHRILWKMILCAIVALIIGLLVYGPSTFATYGWIPTFAAFLSVQVLIVHFGATPAKLVTITILGALITFPCSLFFLHFVVNPLGIPLFCCVAFGLVVAVPVCSEILRLLPWMKQADPAPAPSAEDDLPAPPSMSENKFFFHRVFGDIGELVVWGSSLSIIAMYVGVIISWVLNPLHPAYSMGNLPMMIFAQITTAALAIFIWYPKWKKNGWAFTFASVVFSSAVIITYTNHWLVVALTIIIGAVIFAPLIDWMLKTFNKKGRWHVLFYIQIAIGLCVAIWSLILKHGLIPLLGV